MKTIIRQLVRVGAHDVKTKRIKNPQIDGTDCWGTYEAEKCEIIIKDKMTMSVSEEAWMHEVTHSINIDANSGLNERQVASFSSALYRFMVANGWRDKIAG